MWRGGGQAQASCGLKDSECLGLPADALPLLGALQSLGLTLHQVPHARDSVADEAVRGTASDPPVRLLTLPVCVSPARGLADQAGLLLHCAAQSGQSAVLRLLGQGEPPGGRGGQATRCSRALLAPHRSPRRLSFLDAPHGKDPPCSLARAPPPRPGQGPPQEHLLPPRLCLPPELGLESCACSGPSCPRPSLPEGSTRTQTPALSPQDAEQDHEPPYEVSVQEEVTARLHFVKFENTYIEACLDFIKDHLVNTETKVIQATGGGAYKFKDLIEEKLQLRSVGATGSGGGVGAADLGSRGQALKGLESELGWLQASGGRSLGRPGWPRGEGGPAPAAALPVLLGQRSLTSSPARGVRLRPRTQQSSRSWGACGWPVQSHLQGRGEGVRLSCVRCVSESHASLRVGG